MRNLSMKKFGTPIGAAPGIASEKVGLSSVGAPSAARPGVRRARLLLARCPALELRRQLLGVEVAGAELLVAARRVGRRRLAAAASGPVCGAGCRRAGLVVAVAGVASAWGCRRRWARRGRSGPGGVRRGRRRRGDRAVVDDLRDRAGDAGDRDLRDGRAGRHVDGARDALARDEDDRDGVQLGLAGARRRRGRTVAAISRDDPLPSVHLEYASPRALLRVTERFDAARCDLPRGPGTPRPRY